MGRHAAPGSGAWVMDDQGVTESLDGIPWFERPKPRRWHRCEPVFRARIEGVLVERCACGAIRNGSPSHPTGIHWDERNQR